MMPGGPGREYEGLSNAVTAGEGELMMLQGPERVRREAEHGLGRAARGKAKRAGFRGAIKYE